MPSNLDDRKYVVELDPKGILKLTEEFPAQCRKALEIANSVAPPKLDNRAGLIVLAGLGGSAAGGDFVRALMEVHGGVPFFVSRDYNLPNYIGVGDVVICASYSGDTEETLSAYADAKKFGAKVVCVTSGGKLKELAEQNGDTIIEVPGGQPPRTAMGYMMIPAVSICERLKTLQPQDYEAAFAQLDQTSAECAVESKGNPAKKLAQALNGTLPLIYGLGSWQGAVATRWKSQINENSKTLCFANVFPELCHNEIIGWAGAEKQSVKKYSVVVLEDGAESPKMRTRLEVTKRLIGDKAVFHHVLAKGETQLAKMLSLTYFGDYVSVYLARLNEVDPEDITSINVLKEELSKV